VDVQLSTPTDQNVKLTTLGGRIKAARKARGLSIIECSSPIQLSRTSLMAWEADNVKNPDVTKLMAFTQLVDVSLEWLLHRTGGDPDLTPKGKVKTALAERSDEKAVSPRAKPRAPTMAAVPEISPALTAHASEFNLTARSYWEIPHEILELSFHATAGETVLMRVATRDGGNVGLSRGDYVLVDTSRTRIDEPGIYMLADPEGKSARRALVVDSNGVLKVVALADDLNRHAEELDPAAIKVLGRVMGTFHPL
jgi:transcriptional regulator with XRE-family HTH domain